MVDLILSSIHKCMDRNTVEVTISKKNNTLIKLLVHDFSEVGEEDEED
jgi:DNA-directed RNA polymerase subunit L